MQCANCGAPLKPTARICIGCGTAVPSDYQAGIAKATPVPTETPLARSNEKLKVEPIAEVSAAPANQPVDDQPIPTLSELAEAKPPPSVLGRTEALSAPIYEAATDEMYIKEHANTAPNHGGSAGPSTSYVATQSTLIKEGQSTVRVVITALVLLSAGGVAGYWYHQKQGAGKTVAISETVAPQPVTNPTIAVLAMLTAAKSRNNAAILSAKVTLDSFPKPDRGDRKLAREKNKLGLDALKVNILESAIARFNEGVAADLSDVEVRNNLGYAFMLAGRLDDAKKTLIESVTLDSGRAAAWANLGQTLAKQGDEDSSIAAFVNTFIFSRAQHKTIEFLTNLSQSDPDPRVKNAAAKALEVPPIKTLRDVPRGGFESYAVPVYRGPLVSPNFRNAPKSYSRFTTVIGQGAGEGVNFAGHYTIIVIGCGAGCRSVVLVDAQTGEIDAKDGKVLRFPLGGEGNYLLTLNFQPDSRLVRARWQDQEGDNPFCIGQDFVLDGPSFKPLQKERQPGRC